MKGTITSSLFTLVAIASLGVSTASAAEEVHVVREGKLIKDALDWPDWKPEENPYWKGWVHCGGKTVDGLFVVEKREKYHSRFQGAKSALGDCELKAVFSCTPDNSAKWNPNITIRDRGRLRFSEDGSKIWLEVRKTPFPLKKFEASCEANVFDGKLHSMAVKRVGDKISFYYDC